ncbi:MAG: effector-associated domain EAD1-containing protein [Caldilineaceae bacterium]
MITIEGIMEKDAPFAQPNNGHLIFAALRDVLADLYPEENAARVVVDDAGLDAKQIPFSSRAQTNWHNILAEAIRQARLDPLLKIALADYAATPVLLAAYGQYRLLIEQGGSLEAPAPLPADADVTIAGDVNLNQGDFVARDKNVRNISAGRDVIGSLLITGDHNQVFVGGYERLQDAYINPQSVFDRVDLAHFTGREWLLAKVDAFLQNHDRGYFILEANAGLGKTAFMAWLVKQRKYIHHFCELTPGLEGMAHALKSLAAQLARAYELQPDGVLPSAATRPDFLYNLLVQAAQCRHPGEKIVIVVDALDEAGAPGNQNVLCLPTGLPEGVFFVVSQRPATTMLTIKDAKTPRHDCRLTAESAENQADMRRFLQSAAVLPEINQAFQASEHQYTAAEFITTLLAKCRGSWIYLYFVLQEIRRGERSPLNLAALPDGMAHYYAQYWQRWRLQTRDNESAINPKWYRIYRPLLAMLAAAQDAITLEQLLAWTKINEPIDLVRWYFEEQWRSFLIVTERERKRHYRLYHATLREFFEGRIEQEDRSAQLSIVKEVAEATRTAHSSLVDRYLDAWGGLEDGLPGLQVHEQRDLDDCYGLRHLTVHLEAAGRIAELHHLLRAEWVWREAIPYQHQGWQGWLDKLLNRQPKRYRERYQNIWYTVRETVGQTDGYLADITCAWRHADKFGATYPHDLAKNDTGYQEIALQCRYALITASFNSLAHNISPELLRELAKKQVWLSQQGLAYACQIPDPQKRLNALTELTPYLAIEQCQEALDVVHCVEDSANPVDALVALAIRFIELGQPTEALGTIDNIKNSFSQVKALIDLLSHLPADDQKKVIQKALHIAQNIEYDSLRAEALTTVIPHLFADKQAKVIQEALDLAQNIQGIESQARVLAILVPRLAEFGQFQEALRLAQNIGLSYYRVQAQVDLFLYLSPSERENVLYEALHVTPLDHHRFTREALLRKLVPHLSLEQIRKVVNIARSLEVGPRPIYVLPILAPQLAKLGHLKEALEAVQCIDDKYFQIQTLGFFAHQLSAKQLQEALDTARSIEDNLLYRVMALGWLVRHLPPDEQEKVLQEAQEAAHSITQSDVRAMAQRSYLVKLSAKQLREELRFAQHIDDIGTQSKALADLAIHLAKLGQRSEALSIAQRIKTRYNRAIALATLTPHFSEDEQRKIIRNALNLAQSTTDSYYQTETFADLAPYLMADEQEKALQEALRAAQNIENWISKGNALTQIATRLAELGRLQEALHTARSIRDSDYRAMALANLTPYLSTDQQEKAIQEALKLAPHIFSSAFQAKILTTLTPNLSIEHLQEALDTKILNSDHRGRALANLFARFAELGQLQEALHIVQNIDYPIWALDILALYFSFDEQGEIPQAVRRTNLGFTNGYPQAKALSTQVARLAKQGQLKEALHTAYRIEDHSLQAEALTNLAPKLEAMEQKKAIQAALYAAQNISDSDLRSKALTNLVPQLIELPLNESHALWCKTLPVLSRRTRADLLTDVAALAKFITHLGGAAAIIEIIQAIDDAGKWWP